MPATTSSASKKPRKRIFLYVTKNSLPVVSKKRTGRHTSHSGIFQPPSGPARQLAPIQVWAAQDSLAPTKVWTSDSSTGNAAYLCTCATANDFMVTHPPRDPHIAQTQRGVPIVPSRSCRSAPVERVPLPYILSSLNAFLEYHYMLSSHNASLERTYHYLPTSSNAFLERVPVNDSLSKYFRLVDEGKSSKRLEYPKRLNIC